MEDNGPPALANLGNTCYVNSVVQMLMASGPIVTCLMNSPAAENLELTSLVMSMRFTGDKQVVVPSDFVERICVPNSLWVTQYGAMLGSQQCASEFLQFLLESIQELRECVKFQVLVNDATQQQTTLKVGLEDFGSLNLQTLITTQYPGILSLSHTLIIVLSRWNFDNGKVMKNSASVSVPLCLNLRDEFQLRAVISHVGVNVHSGHYVTHVEYEGRWFLCDDSQVNVVSVPDVERAAATAFIFMYEKVDGEVKIQESREEAEDQVIKVEDEEPVPPSDVKAGQSSDHDKKRTLVQMLGDNLTGMAVVCALKMLRPMADLPGTQSGGQSAVQSGDQSVKTSGDVNFDDVYGDKNP